MIAYVRGEVAQVTLTSAVLDVGGVGLELQCTPGTLAALRAAVAADLVGRTGTRSTREVGDALAARVAG